MIGDGVVGHEEFIACRAGLMDRPRFEKANPPGHGNAQEKCRSQQGTVV